MRRFPYIIEQEFGKNTLELYQKLERTVLKISDYKNHRRFSLRCLSKDVAPVSLKLKNNIRTYKSKCIIHKTERKLLIKRIRNINNTIESLEHVKYIWCRFLILLVESCSKLVISVTEHLVEVVDKLSTTTVVFFRSERILKCMHLYGA